VPVPRAFEANDAAPAAENAATVTAPTVPARDHHGRPVRGGRGA
jgi:hypothetical protein